MANIILSEQSRRNRDFEYLVDGQFEIVPGGRDALFAAMGEYAVGLAQVIDNYYLPNIRNGIIRTPRDFDVNSEKTPLIPVMEDDTILRVHPDEQDLILPTIQQCESNGFIESDFEWLSNMRNYPIDDYTVGFVNTSLGRVIAYDDAGLVCTNTVPEEGRVSYTRPLTAMRKDQSASLAKRKIKTMSTLLHETKHVIQNMTWNPNERPEPEMSVKKEIEAYDVSLVTKMAMANLVFPDEKDAISGYEMEHAIDFFAQEYEDWCDNNKADCSVKGFIEWFHNVRAWDQSEAQNKKEIWSALSNAD